MLSSKKQHPLYLFDTLKGKNWHSYDDAKTMPFMYPALVSYLAWLQIFPNDESKVVNSLLIYEYLF